MFILLIKGLLLVLLLTFVVCCCIVIVSSTYETVIGRNKGSNKEWLHEKCNTNTSPKRVPEEPPSTRLKSLKELNTETNKDIQEQKEIKGRMVPLKVSEGFSCIYKSDVYVLVEQNGFLPVLKLMEFQDLDEKYRWLEQWNL